jgi:hypothetical protein
MKNANVFIVILMIGIFVVGVMAISTKQKLSWEKEKVIEAEKIHTIDSTNFVRVQKDYVHIMNLLNRGITTGDSVYFVDKKKETYLILFIKQEKK